MQTKYNTDMKKQLHTSLIIILSCLFPAASLADEAPDSVAADDTPTELNEIVVEGSNQSTTAEVSTYIPMKRAKNAAQDATSLLFHMSIPQLNVNPMDGSVKTSTGQDVSIFIDYLPATQQDLTGMRTQDVKKVEYYLFPSDPRFQGAKYVVNFVMQKYEWGGYTKINAKQSILVKISNASVFSKFSYKKMTFDAYASEYYFTDRHIGTRNTEIFNLPDFNSQGPQTIERTSETLSSRHRRNNNSFSFRALYNTGKLYVSNTIAYGIYNTPRDNSVTSLSFRPEISGGETSTTFSSGKNNSFNYNGTFYIVFSDKCYFSTNLSYLNSRNNSNSDYTLNSGLSIINNARENSNTYSIYPQITWQPNSKHRFLVQGGLDQSWTTIDYYGNTPSVQKYFNGVYFGVVGYHLVLSKFYGGVNFSWMWNRNTISGIHNNQNYPYVAMYASYSPTDKHQLMAYFHYNNQTPTASQKSPNMIQANELMWHSGNPDLGIYSYFYPGFSYTWLPSNRWQFAAAGSYYILKDRIISLYTPDGSDGTMLQKYVNDGDYRELNVSVSATGKFLDGALVVNIRPSYMNYHASGVYPWAKSRLLCSAQVSYYFGNFYATASYSTPTISQHSSGVIMRSPAEYMIKLGWGSGNWNASLYAGNFFHSSWKSYRNTLSGEYYSYDNQTYSTRFHANYELALTYTFGYGKKVQRGDELSGGSAGSSAILK